MDEKTVVEEWRAINGRSMYEVSSLGRVRSWIKPGRCPSRTDSPRMIRVFIDRDGYAQVKLYANGEVISKSVHRLVLEQFVSERPSGTEARHLDGDKTNNSVDNLEWATHAENMRDLDKHGARARFERAGRAKLTLEKVYEIRRRYAAGGITHAKLADEYGVCAATIGFVVTHRTWVLR